MLEVRCADCQQLLDAARYPAGVAGLVHLCADCALRRLRLARGVDERDGWRDEPLPA